MRIVLFTIDLPQANRMTDAIVDRYRDEVVGIIESTAIVPGRSNLDAIVHVSQRSGVRFLLQIEAERIVSRIAAAIRRMRARAVSLIAA